VQARVGHYQVRLSAALDWGRLKRTLCQARRFPGVNDGAPIKQQVQIHDPRSASLQPFPTHCFFYGEQALQNLHRSDSPN